MTEQEPENSPPEHRMSARQEVLLAAAELAGYKTDVEFTEWALTVKAWELNHHRWGLPGFEDRFPDHKRVMNELMAAGTERIVGRGWLDRPRPNHYLLTASGLAQALTLKPSNRTDASRDRAIYDAVSPFAFHRVFEAYLGNDAEPKTWLGASSFLGLSRNDPQLLERRLAAQRSAINSAMEFMKANGVDPLRRGDSGRSLSMERLERLDKFVQVLETRFQREFAAIRAMKHD